jgi:hypothetical protein
MRSSTIVLVVGLLASPLALLASPDNTASAAGFPLVADIQGDSTIQSQHLQDAPVPSVGPAGVAPVDRAAGAGGRTLDAGPTNSTPFSSTPSGTLSSGGAQISNADRVDSAAGGAGVTPNLGK